jgi:Flp pilus assembly protein TadD
MSRMTIRLLALAPVLVLLAGCGGVTSDSDAARTMMRLGDTMLEGDDAAGAAAFYAGAAERAPANPEPRLRLARLYAAANALPQAEEAYRAVLARDAGNTEALAGLAATLLRQERAAEAEGLLTRAAGRDPRLLRNLGVSLDMQGRHAEAAAAYRRGLAQTDDPDLRANLALSLALAGDPAALAEARAAVARPTASPRNRRTLAMVHALAGDQAGARTAAAQAGMTAGETAELLDRAARARAAPPAQRAAQLGIVTASAVR